MMALMIDGDYWTLQNNKTQLMLRIPSIRYTRKCLQIKTTSNEPKTQHLGRNNVRIVVNLFFNCSDNAYFFHVIKAENKYV